MQMLKSSGFIVLGLVPTREAAGLFRVEVLAVPGDLDTSVEYAPGTLNGKSDIALLLHTSGTFLG
jgi:hypothetical protein